MRLFLSHETALQCWRSATPSEKQLQARCRIPEGFTPSLTAKEERWLQEHFNLSSPVCTSVKDETCRRSGKLLHSYTHKPALPYDEYFNLGKETWLASPSLLLAQLAGSLVAPHSLLNTCKPSSLREKVGPVILSMLASELASNYRLDSASEDGFKEVVPVLTRAELRTFLDATTSFKGRNILEQAAEMMIENSNSPMETLVAHVITLPFSYGGFSLSKMPILNKRIETKHEGREGIRYGDIVFPDEKIIVEYNGFYHKGERANEDDQRRNELIAQGNAVLVLNFEQIVKPVLLEETLGPVINAVGTLGRKPSSYIQRRKDLLSILFEINGTDCSLNRRCFIPEVLKASGTRTNSV